MAKMYSHVRTSVWLHYCWATGYCVKAPWQVKVYQGSTIWGFIIFQCLKLSVLNEKETVKNSQTEYVVITEGFHVASNS